MKSFGVLVLAAVLWGCEVLPGRCDDPVRKGAADTCVGPTSAGGGDDDGSTTPEPTPVPLYFSTDDIDVECTGTFDDSIWNYYIYIEGEGSDTRVTVYDNSDFGYGGDTSAVYTETFSLELEEEYKDDSIVTAQDWSRVVADHVESLDQQIEDENTLFDCENLDFLTYVFCSSDAADGSERCVGAGPEADAQCPGCVDIVETVP